MERRGGRGVTARRARVAGLECSAVVGELLHSGPSAVGDAQLLSLVFEVGWPQSLAEFRALLRQPAPELAFDGRVNALGLARFHAALELMRRATADGARGLIRNATDVERIVRPRLFGARREQVYVLALDARSALMSLTCVAEGQADSCVVDPREVFAPALAVRATAIALAHNHPSGSELPSRSDVDLTSQLERAARLLRIQLVDHVIVAGERTFSMAAHGMLGREALDVAPEVHDGA